jgi:hypothetical protein
MGKFDLKIDKNGASWKVQIAGVIDEDADFTPFGLDGAPAVELHLGDIKSINSCGIREWIKWMGTSKAAPVEYHQCPKIIVDQINMVQGFLPAQGRVMSFYVPFYSDDSGTEKNVLFTLGKEYTEQGLGEPPAVKDEDGNSMEMDVVEAKYFKFLKK